MLGAVPIALGAAVRHAGSGRRRSPLPAGLPSSGALLGTAYATLVGVIFCHWAWFRLVAILPAAVAAIGTLGIPIVGLFTSALVLGEPVGSAEVVALVLVVAGLGILVGGLAAEAPESLPGAPGRLKSQEGVEMTARRRPPTRVPPIRSCGCFRCSPCWSARGAGAPRPPDRVRPSFPSTRTTSSSPSGGRSSGRPPSCGRWADDSLDRRRGRLTLAFFGLDAGGRIVSRGTTYLRSEFGSRSIPFAVELTPDRPRGQLRAAHPELPRPGLRTN